MNLRKLITKITIIAISLIATSLILIYNLTNIVNTTNVIIIYLLLVVSFSLLFFSKKRIKLVDEILDFITFVINTIAVLLIIITFVIMPARVDGESMLPTYKNNDRVFVNMFNVKIEKDDIVVYKLDDTLIIKRVVATEDDIISVKKLEDENKYYLLINNERYLNDYDQYYLLEPHNGFQLFNQIIENSNELKLKEGELILLGDNALNSSDSRRSGVSTIDDIVGKVMGGLFG